MRNGQFGINEKGHLTFAGCDTVELAEKYGTPLYVMSEDGIRENCRRVKSVLTDKYPNTFALYASKAFSASYLYKIIREEGLGIDVVSGGELYIAERAGFPMEKVYFHGNNKTREEIEFGMDREVGYFVVDNCYEMDLIREEAEKRKKKVKVLIRVSPGVSAHTHEYISTGQLDSKFGFPVEGGEALEAIGRAAACPDMELKGIHCHIGSQIFNEDAYRDAAKVMIDLMLQAKRRFGIEMEQVNIGGGFGIFYKEGDVPPDIGKVIDMVMETIQSLCSGNDLRMPRIIIEPGRWIVGENGITLYTIGSMKEIKGIRKYVSVDGGMTDNPRTALYQAEYEAVVANKADKEPEELVTIAGKCCESGDILIWDIKLPRIEHGDILAVFSTGAYNYTMSSNYNRLRKPAVVMLSGGRSKIIVKRETYEDLVRNDLD